MSKSCNKISSEIKSQILSELQVPGCIVSGLAKKYNISNTTIYTWQRQRQKIGIDDGSAVNGGGKFGGSKFVELSVSDSGNSTLEKSTLEKASLIFNDFSLVIEGRVKSSSLLAILQILEESC